MIQMTGIYHIGIPVGDLDRAERFYSEILGMKVAAQFREGNTPLTRPKCGDEDVVLSKRPKPLNRNSLRRDVIAHQAFEVPPETFDKAIEFLKDKS
jgi:catechol 2,3-dioxygenase-like lactoylglutathione lyase family enzyme